VTDFVFGWLFGAMTAATATPFLVRWADRKFYRPYRWRCRVRGCRLEVAGTDPGQVAGWSNQHKHPARGEHT